MAGFELGVSVFVSSKINGFGQQAKLLTNGALFLKVLMMLARG